MPDGLTGRMHGYMELVVRNGTYDAEATCVEPCYTADFVASVFGPTATRTVTTWAFFYNAGPNGTWKNASADQGGNSGDIIG